jgi:hypothetical protein
MPGFEDGVETNQPTIHRRVSKKENQASECSNTSFFSKQYKACGRDSPRLLTFLLYWIPFRLLDVTSSIEIVLASHMNNGCFLGNAMRLYSYP